MALNKQVWLKDLQENFYPDDSFVVKSVDDSPFVSFNRVHIPNAGKPSNVEKNRNGVGTGFQTRQDADLEYSIDEFTTDAVRISNIDTVELSYDKRQSVLYNDKMELQRRAHIEILERWGKGYGAVIKTTGASVKAHTSTTATGNRKRIKRDDILSLMTLFDKQEIPATERYLLLDAEMYAHLLGDLTESDKYAFHASADAQRGILGNLYSFNIMKRSSVLRVKSDAETILFEGEAHEATECACALAWHKSCVSRALGEVNMFDRTNDPLLYGDGYSFLVRTGGSHRRTDKRGVALLVEATA